MQERLSKQLKNITFCSGVLLDEKYFLLIFDEGKCGKIHVLHWSQDGRITCFALLICYRLFQDVDFFDCLASKTESAAQNSKEFQFCSALALQKVRETNFRQNPVLICKISSLKVSLLNVDTTDSSFWCFENHKMSARNSLNGKMTLSA